MIAWAAGGTGSNLKPAPIQCASQEAGGGPACTSVAVSSLNSAPESSDRSDHLHYRARRSRHPAGLGDDRIRGNAQPTDPAAKLLRRHLASQPPAADAARLFADDPPRATSRAESLPQPAVVLAAAGERGTHAVQAFGSGGPPHVRRRGSQTPRRLVVRVFPLSGTVHSKRHRVLRMRVCVCCASPARTRARLNNLIPSMIGRPVCGVAHAPTNDCLEHPRHSGHEGSGSVLALLKGRGLATSLSAGLDEGDSTSAAALFRVSVELTPAGVGQADVVIEYVCFFAGLLTALGGAALEWLWTEMRDVAALSFVSRRWELNTPRWCSGNCRVHSPVHRVRAPVTDDVPPVDSATPRSRTSVPTRVASRSACRGATHHRRRSPRTPFTGSTSLRSWMKSSRASCRVDWS